MAFQTARDGVKVFDAEVYAICQVLRLFEAREEKSTSYTLHGLLRPDGGNQQSPNGQSGSRTGLQSNDPGQ